MNDYPRLKTERLTLRRFKKTDAPLVHMLAGDYEIAKNTLNIPHPYTLDMAESWIATHKKEYQSGREIIFAIVADEINGLVGAIGLIITQRFCRGELGYWIGKPHWGRGYATEAAQAVLSYGFNVLKLNKISATHMTRNPQSGKVMRKLGMEPEGLFRQHVLKWDQFLDLAAYGILSEAWQRNHEL